MALTVQDILNAVFPAYAATRKLPGRIHRAAIAIRRCRTAALGAHARHCPEGHVRHVHYNSCRHRSCPTCAAPRAARWLAALQNRRLPTRHFQLVFTIAHELLPLWRYNQKHLGDALFRAARLSILSLLGDRRQLGVCPGFVLSLHTWGEELQLHPHLHGLITAGGLTAGGQWKPSAEGYLVWGPALRDAFRDRFLGEIRRLLDCNQLTLPPDQDRVGVRGMLDEIGQKLWNVRIEKPYAHGRGLAVYLARYLRGGPVKDHRLRTFDGKSVQFTCRRHRGRNGQKARWRTARLPAPLFVGRLLEHVAPRGFHVVRAGGLYAGGQSRKLEQARTALAASQSGSEAAPLPSAAPCLFTTPDPATCPVCGRQLVVIPWFAEVPSPIGARDGPLPASKSP
jgi:hypothetical protein